MSETKPRFNQLNLVVEDIDAAVAFYLALGMSVRFDGGEWPAGSGARHVALDNGDAAIVELDNIAMARIYHAGWRSLDTGNPVVLGFSLPSREAVDERYQVLIAAGFCTPDAKSPTTRSSAPATPSFATRPATTSVS